MAHLLKRLELNGFKSFAQKTTLEFPAGITAIVGPNGSGKSNVVDAIRWLLGEREAKHLRGGKVEDLIFAGTQKRARLGQAHASLHFDNAKRFFPLDFAEISVAREVRRDGVSRYFLNKAEILLRDLVDFFAKARLGSRGLVVVTQGNSDVFIQATPAGRREMIEEILGLREFQIKKVEAERRLKGSEANLDKVRALTEEILPHLRSLKRQTHRWEKRSSLEDELRAYEERLYGSQLHEFAASLEEIQKDIRAHEEKRKGLIGRREKAETRVQEVEESQPTERKEHAVVQEEIRTCVAKRSVLQKDIGRLEASIEFEEARSFKGVSDRPREELVAGLRHLKELLSQSLEKDTALLREVIKSALHEVDDLLGKSREEANTHPPSSLKRDLQKVQRDLAALETELMKLQEKEQALQNHQEEFYGAYKEAVTELQHAKEELELWGKKEQEKQFEKERIELRQEELVRQIEQADRNPKEFLRSDAPPTLSETERHELERRILKLRGDLASIGEVDTGLMKEAQETEERYHYLEREAADLSKAQHDLTQLIEELNDKVRAEFSRALQDINKSFAEFFVLMFGGGQARLRLEVPRVVAHESESDDVKEQEESDEPTAERQEESGVLIDIRLPRKRINSLEVLSGGERSLVGIAALFALISVSPPPFLVLDEVDAALDDRNAQRFAHMLKEFSKKTQFLVVTHNRATMEVAHVLYGVTLNEDGTSKILSLRLEDAPVTA